MNRLHALFLALSLGTLSTATAHTQLFACRVVAAASAAIACDLWLEKRIPDAHTMLHEAHARNLEKAKRLLQKIQIRAKELLHTGTVHEKKDD